MFIRSRHHRSLRSLLSLRSTGAWSQPHACRSRLYHTLVFQGGTAETLLDISFLPEVSLLDLLCY